MNILPLNDKILVERVEAEEKTAGGIMLPDTAREKPKQGKVPVDVVKAAFSKAPPRFQGRRATRSSSPATAEQAARSRS